MTTEISNIDAQVLAALAAHEEFVKELADCRVAKVQGSQAYEHAVLSLERLAGLVRKANANDNLPVLKEETEIVWPLDSEFSVDESTARRCLYLSIEPSDPSESSHPGLVFEVTECSDSDNTRWIASIFQCDPRNHRRIAKVEEKSSLWYTVEESYNNHKD